MCVKSSFLVFSTWITVYLLHYAKEHMTQNFQTSEWKTVLEFFNNKISSHQFKKYLGIYAP